MPSPTARPNILVIIVHDLGTHLGCYGDSSVRSPNLDKLASEGVRMESHFGTAAYCSPARGSLFTGRYPHSNGLLGLVNLGWDLPESSVTIARSLGEAGYETFLFGMQHEKKDPSRLGFDHVGERSLGSTCSKVAPLVTHFLDERGASDGRPFYARVGFSEVHRRYDGFSAERANEVNVPPFMKDTPGAREDLAMFHGSIEHMDSSVGEVLEALDRNGLRENTLVVFTTDHGIAFPRAKATIYDPGIHTTMLMRWPGGNLPEGRVFPEMVSGVDLSPTLHEAAGVEPPPGVQGRSYLGLLQGRNYEPRTEVFAGQNTAPDDIKRGIRTARYKYIRNYDEGPTLRLPTDIETSLTRRDLGDEHLAPRPAVELYDLESDPLEMVNLAGRPEMAAVEQDLASRLDRFQRETDDPILSGTIPRPAEEPELFRKAWERAREMKERAERA